jgi:predicted ABC-type ATPase
MPTNVVKTHEDEEHWEKAKQKAAEEGHAEDWAYVMSIYQKMRGGKHMSKSDSLTLSYIASKLDGEALEKSMAHAGLVYIQKPVRKHGKTFLQGFWVHPSEFNAEKHAKYKMKETREMHMTRDGYYTRERHQLHKDIVKKVIAQSERAKPGEKPVAILMGGGSASGKSTMREAVIEPMLKQQGIKAGTVDTDEIKKEIPEFNSLVKTKPEEAASLVHNESADVGALMLDTLIDQKRHFIYDGTAKNPKRYESLVKRLKDAGYEVHLYVADVPLEVAKERSDARAKATGRTVPHSIIESSHRGVPKTVEHIKDMVDSYQVYDNTDKLQLIASNDHIDPEKYTKFLEKGGVQYAAKANT